MARVSGVSHANPLTYLDFGTPGLIAVLPRTTGDKGWIASLPAR
jgi:hypothetical protein